ncbi:DUF3231 family protein [Texcoconibacillus texcoconensis]|uniref:DUF3231 family protein n=1 Tax=Texcoconibacillus texcoconensis TaxID=1095777 RepID=A0A840QGW5_9BACI|nr:DUF3231 family protein [Texcoconibacillus texcoconensis]MBB5171892.1 hypothetical protein [Texcoconibacillus texcoconensis]
MERSKNIPLTAGEMSALWNGYNTETMALYTFKHFEMVVDDDEIKKDILSAIELFQNNSKEIRKIFESENHPVPVGFTERDVNLNAPKLFSDETAQYLLKFISENGMQFYPTCLKFTSREDIRQFCTESSDKYISLVNQVTKTLLTKGMYVRPPQISAPEQVDFVKKKSHLTGWLGERRPIHATQITHIFLNIQRNILGKTLLTGFSQTVKSEKIKKFLTKGKEMSKKKLDEFHLLLQDVDIEVSLPSNFNVTNSTQPPYSDKMMLEIILTTIRYAIAFYGEALAVSTRRDLFTFYNKTIAEVTLYANECVELEIEFGYLEEQPKALDHDDIINKND